MKKLISLLIVTSLIGCTKDPFNVIEPPTVPNSLQINSTVGIKLENPFVTTEVSMNVKSDITQDVTIRIFDISNKTVSKEVMRVNAGDNILKVYTSALPSSAYRIGLFDSKGNQLGITDFNKL